MPRVWVNHRWLFLSSCPEGDRKTGLRLPPPQPAVAKSWHHQEDRERNEEDGVWPSPRVSSEKRSPSAHLGQVWQWTDFTISFSTPVCASEYATRMQPVCLHTKHRISSHLHPGWATALIHSHTEKLIVFGSLRPLKVFLTVHCNFLLYSAPSYPVACKDRGSTLRGSLPMY